MLGFCSHTYSEGDTVRALLGEVFYTVTVTDTELWLAVGRVLQRARLDKMWKVLDVERATLIPDQSVLGVRGDRLGCRLALHVQPAHGGGRAGVLGGGGGRVRGLARPPGRPPRPDCRTALRVAVQSLRPAR